MPARACGGRQPGTTLLPATFTGTEGNGFVAGPCRTAPVSESNTDPWQGHLSSVGLMTITAQALWVHTELNATTSPAVGWATTICAPLATLAAIAPPTGTLLSSMMAFAAGAAVDDTAEVREVLTGEVVADDRVTGGLAARDGAVDPVVDAEDDPVDDEAAEDDPAGDDPAGDDPAGDDPAADDPADDDPADDDTDVDTEDADEGTVEGTAAEDGAAGDGDADGAAADAAESALPEPPHPVSVSAPAPSPAAIRARRRLTRVPGASAASGESAAGSLGVVMHWVTSRLPKRFISRRVNLSGRVVVLIRGAWTPPMWRTTRS